MVGGGVGADQGGRLSEGPRLSPNVRDFVVDSPIVANLVIHQHLRLVRFLLLVSPDPVRQCGVLHYRRHRRNSRALLLAGRTLKRIFVSGF